MKVARTIIFAGLLVSEPASAENSVTITLSGHQFSPAEVHVRANEPTTALLINADRGRVEFVSSSLKIKRVLAGCAKGTMRWRALAPGHYPFFEEFDTEIAHGIVIAE